MKYWRIIILLIITLCCIALGLAFYNYYIPPTERKAYMIPRHHDDTLRIAYLGDSWAAMHKEHECVIAQMVEDSINRPVKVSSFGIHGKTSKEIYDNLFDNMDMRHFIMQGFDYCFISAGINDTYKKMSTDYYMISMDYMIRFMLTNHISPIILEIPDYNISKAYDRQQTVRKNLRKISTLITGTQMDCKQVFRKALEDLISNNNYRHKISVIKYQEWNSNYNEDLRSYYVSDGMHLNQTGYLRLDSCIAQHIIQQID